MRAQVVAVVVALAAASALAHQDKPGQTFRTGRDVVVVDVAVRAGGRAVTGLRAGDFVVTDNGVRQRIESIEATSVPIDVTLVVDVSGNPSGSWSDGARETIAQLDGEVSRVKDLLRPADRLRLLAVDTSIQQVFGMQPVSSLRPLSGIESGGLSSLYDTLAAALLYPGEAARRHVVIARTKGIDTVSAIDARALGEIAARSDALVHVVAMETALDNEAALSQFQCGLMGLCWPTRRSWMPHRRQLFAGRPFHQLSRDGQLVSDGVQATGGDFHQAQMLSEPTLIGTFRKVFDDFRNNYVVRYTPEGVERTGWHAIEVKIPGTRGYQVRARRGYLVEGDAPPAARRPVPERPATLAEFTVAYESGAYTQVTSGVRKLEDPARLLRDFQEQGNPWPGAPRMEAAFALELVEPAVFSPRGSTRTSGYEFIERFGRLVRHPLAPDQFELYWHFAALTLLEGSIRPEATEAHVTRALQRFPDEPRFVLSRAIVTDQRWSTRGQTAAVDERGRPTPAHVDAVRRAYDAAVALPAISAEARIRLAWFVHRLGRHEEALEQLTLANAQPIADPALRYLRELFLGHVLWALERQPAAIEAYRAALALNPSAQSARVALMNAWLLSGNTPQAEALAEQAQVETAGSSDPWWMYWQGQYRLYPLAMARVREMSR